VIDSVQSYPCAERLSLVEQVHGRSVADPYRWLEDSSTAETKDWSRAQDDLWLTYAGTLSSRFRWKNRVRQLSEVSSVSTPVWRGGRCFTLRREPGFIAVTSRASVEMVQKAAVAGAPLLAAVSAPTSLAVETADAVQMALVGLARQGNLVVYSHAERIVFAEQETLK